MAKKKSKAEDGIVKVEEALSKTEKFIESNQKLLTIVIGGVVVLVLAFFGINRFYMTPREQEAKEQMFMAERYFEIDSLNLALNGDGMYPGFLEIIDDYRWTKSANLSKYYAGICYLKLGNAEEAAGYLKSFKGKDEIIGPMARGALADAYMELGESSKAVSSYLSAAKMRKNDLTTPLFLMKAATAYETMNEFKKALPLYDQIKKEFPNSVEAREIEKYITRAKGMM